MISIVTAVLVLFLAGSAFVLSYDALHDLALDNQIKPSLAWLWPLTLDAFMVAASLAVLRASLNSEGKVYPWLLVGAFTLASIAFNVVHAPDTLLARAIFALPPAVVFLAFELLMSQTAATVRRQATITSVQAIIVQREAVAAEVGHLAARRDNLKAELAALKQQKRAAIPVTSDVTRERANEILAERPDISGAELGRMLDRSESLGRKLKRELIPVNGNEVIQ
jgi:hypothetical protein